MTSTISAVLDDASASVTTVHHERTTIGLSPFFDGRADARDASACDYLRRVVLQASRMRRRALLAARYYLLKAREVREGAAAGVTGPNAGTFLDLVLLAQAEHVKAHEQGERLRIYRDALRDVGVY